MFHSPNLNAPLPVAPPRLSGFEELHYDDHQIYAAGRLFRAVIGQISVDIHDLRTRISGASRARDISPEAIGYGRGVEEHVDLIVSVCATASLIGYRHDNRVRLLFGIDEKDARCVRLAKKIAADLDALRDILLPLASSVPAYYRSRRYSADYARALSCLFIALDAIPADDTYLRRSIIAFAPISQRSNDPVGDAQMWAEEADAAADEIN